MSIVYINSRDRVTEYPVVESEHPLIKHVERDAGRDRPPSMAGNIIPRPIGNTFWGRLSAYDHLAVKRMIKKLLDFEDVSWHYNIEEATRLCENLEVDLDLEVMKKVEDNYIITPSIIAGVVYMTTNLSHRKVASLFNLSATNVLNKKKKLEEKI